MHDSECILESELGECVAAPLSSDPIRSDHQRARVLLLPRTRDEAAAAMLRGVAQHQQPHRDWHVQVDERARTNAEMRWLLAQGWSGVISRNTTAVLVETCAELRVPLVDIDDTPPFSGVPKIRADHAAVGALGAECFLGRGFAHFAFVGGEEQAWARERRTGFAEAVREAHHEPLHYVTEAGDQDLARREQEVRQLADWLERLPKPVGTMACDDRTAALVLEAAQLAGLHVPEEVAVLGADNETALCELLAPSLSSVVSGAFQIGFCAAEHLQRMLCDPATPVCDRRLDPEGIAHRRTTDVLAIPDRAVAAAVRYIAEHACEGLTVEAVLPHAAASRSQLEKKFRRYLGRSPQMEIRRVQLARIRKMLSETDLPLKEIASLTGFAHMEYLCVVFRRLTGETPGTYRRRFRAPGGVRLHGLPSCPPAEAWIRIPVCPRAGKPEGASAGSSGGKCPA